MNVSQSTLLRALHGLAYSALLLTVFEACSGDEANAPLPPPGPASVAITGISLGQGFVGEGGASSVLACDYNIGVNVQTTNWTLLGPGRCGGALQCGQLRVSLSAASGRAVPSVIAAANGVVVNVRELVPASPAPDGERYTVQVELVDDSGKAYVALDGGNGSVETEFSMSFPKDCAGADGGSGSGAGGDSGAGSGGSGGGDSGAGA